MKTIILEERGYFWWHNEPIPKNHFAPDSSITGTLKIDEEGRVELELDGVLSSDGNPFAALHGYGEPFSSDKNIQGILKSSNKFALLIGLVKNGGSSNQMEFLTRDTLR